MSTMGAKAQWMPTDLASRAATAWPCSIVGGSHDAAIAMGTGKIVRKPWMTSNPNSTGMPCLLPSMAIRCSRLASAGSVTNSSEPASPRARASSTPKGWLALAPSTVPSVVASRRKPK